MTVTRELWFFGTDKELRLSVDDRVRGKDLQRTRRRTLGQKTYNRKGDPGGHTSHDTDLSSKIRPQGQWTRVWGTVTNKPV